MDTETSYSNNRFVPVSERALVQRINRKLAHNGERLKRCRGERCRQSVGDFYIIDVSCNCVIRHDVDIEDVGRECGALAGHERLVRMDD